MEKATLKLTSKLIRLGMSCPEALATAQEATGKAQRICTGRQYGRLERWALLQYLAFSAWSKRAPATIELPAVRLREAIPASISHAAYMVTLRRPLNVEATGDGITFGAVCGVNILASVNAWCSCRGCETLNATLFIPAETGNDSILLCGQTAFQQVLPAGTLLYLEARRVGKYVHTSTFF